MAQLVASGLRTIGTGRIRARTAAGMTFSMAAESDGLHGVSLLHVSGFR